jgi:uncharacterized protein (DUF1330 family)
MSYIDPTGEQLQRFMENGPDGPIVMLNLLKFRDKAAYADDAGEPERSGAEAYGVYSETALQKVQGVGGSLFFGSPAHAAVIGPEDEWDMVALVQYPNRQAFLTMVSDPEYQACAHHRSAALADSRLIPMTSPEGQ